MVHWSQRDGRPPPTPWRRLPRTRREARTATRGRDADAKRSCREPLSSVEKQPPTARAAGATSSTMFLLEFSCTRYAAKAIPLRFAKSSSGCSARGHCGPPQAPRAPGVIGDGDPLRNVRFDRSRKLIERDITRLPQAKDVVRFARRGAFAAISAGGEVASNCPGHLDKTARRERWSAGCRAPDQGTLGA